MIGSDEYREAVGTKGRKKERWKIIFKMRQ
jgi:hypothetical protein